MVQSPITTRLVSVPILSIVTETWSPAVSGPTPAGVPVSRTSPGSSVITWLTYATRPGTLQSSSEVGGVRPGLHPGPERAERVEPLGPGPLPVPGLQVPRGDVVSAGVAEDHLVGALRWHLAAQPADDDRELPLEVDPFGELHRVLDRVTRPGHRGGRLEEQHRLRRRLAV